MPKTFSPLRYPGGKTKIYDKVNRLINQNNFNNKTYVEPFAGGFGIGIGLLVDGVVEKTILNDVDHHIYNFWYAVLYRTDELIKLICNTSINIEERERQKSIYLDDSSDEISDGFATFFLNRVNFSGVIKGGPIGGALQKGAHKLDCRFNRAELIKKIERIALLNNKIDLYNLDANEFIINHLDRYRPSTFLNIDPPYVKKGYQLYTNYFSELDHRKLAITITKHLKSIPWIVTYDNSDLIREIYSDYYMQDYSIYHNAGSYVKGTEIVVTNIERENFVW